jgi:hypothetical protein
MVASSFLLISQGLNLEAVGQTNETHLQNETGPSIKNGPLAIAAKIILIGAGIKQIMDGGLRGMFAS